MKETPSVEQLCITNAKKALKSIHYSNKLTYEQKEYKIGPDAHTQSGRYYNESSKKRAVTAPNAGRHIRRLVMKYKYVELDMVNTHPK